jgi:hypothetical protein
MFYIRYSVNDVYHVLQHSRTVQFACLQNLFYGFLIILSVKNHYFPKCKYN